MNLAVAFSLVALVCYGALVVVVVRRGLRVRVNQLFTLYLMTMLVWQMANIMISFSQTAEAALLGYRVLIAAAAGQFILFFFFVRAMLHARVPRRYTLVGTLAWLTTVLALLTDEHHFFTDIHRSAATGLFVPDFGPVLMVTAISNYSFLGIGIGNLVQGYRRATTDLERNRLRYVLLAVVIILVGTLANFVPALQAYPVEVSANIISAMLFAYAVLRYRLLDITFVVRRSLAYSMLTAAIAVVYVLSILLFEYMVRHLLGLGAFLIPVALAMVAAFLLRPWRERVQAWIDVVLFREKYDSRRMLERLSRRTATILDLDALGNMLLSEICSTMRAERAALLLKEEDNRSYYIAAQRDLDPQAWRLRLGHDHPVVQWLLRADRPLYAQELDTLPQFRSLWGQEREELNRLGAGLFVPLQVMDDLVGILVVGTRLGGGYSRDDEITLSTLANQTAVAVENARLFARTRARVAELTALQEIGVRLVSSRRLPAVLQVVVESGVRLLDADEAYVALYDAARERFSVSRGLAASGVDLAVPWNLAAALPLQMAVRDGKPIIISDLWLQEAIPPALARQSPIRALAAHPLRAGAASIGVLAVTHHRPHAFSEEELRLLGMLSDQASLAIDNAQLLESERARRQLADRLREVSRVIGSTLELDTLLELVLEQLHGVVAYDHAAIMLLAGEQLEVSNTRGHEELGEYAGAVIALADYPLFEEMIREQKPVISDDIQQDKRWVSVGGERRIRSFIGVPLVLRDQPRGILTMGCSEPGRYQDDDLRNASAFANQAAMAIENARLYRETIEEKRKSETILKETFSGIVVTDVDLRIVSFNSGAEVITGYSAGEAIGKRLPEILGPDVTAPNGPLGSAIATGQRVPPQETVIQAATGLRDILLGTVPLLDAQHKLFGYLLSFTDITRLKEVDRLKTDIVANVSHELRTPLASIKAYTELLLDNIEGEDQSLRDQFLRVIDQETDRLAELISDTLDLSRLEAGRFEVRKVQLNLGELLAHVLSMLDVQRSKRELTVRSEVPADLPPLLADRDMMTIILKNLLANAIKFSHRGGEVLVVLRQTPEHVVLQVADHGIGIPEDALPHLFQKFYRVPSAVDAGFEGTGLGLVLTKQAVEAQGGTIEVESQVGVGTTFTVRLPWQ